MGAEGNRDSLRLAPNSLPAQTLTKEVRKNFPTQNSSEYLIVIWRSVVINGAYAMQGRVL